MNNRYCFCSEITFQPLPDIKNTDKIVIFAPHPDDETLGTGGLICEAIRRNAQVTVVLLTDGSRSHDTKAYEAFLNLRNRSIKEPMGDIRRHEVLHAIGELGLDKSRVIFLGYPDGGMRALFNDYWDCDRLYRADNDFNKSDHSPYGFSYLKNAPYCGASVAANLQEIMLALKPDIIFYPDDGDLHDDHWATSAFARYAAIKTGYNGEWYTYLVHKGDDWPSPPRYLPKAGLTLPPELSVLDASWLILPLKPDQVARKGRAINSHASQLFLWKNYLLSFVRSNEIFGAYPYVKMSRVGDDPNFFRDGAPPSSFPDVRMDQKTGSLQTSEDIIRMAMAYNDKSAYLILQSADDINATLLHRFHLRIWDKKQFTRMDIKIRGKEAEYERKAGNSIMPDQKPGLAVKGNMMVISFPFHYIEAADEIMLSGDVSDPQDKIVIDFTSFRDMAFSHKIEEANQP
ncbi:MAG: PIG-L family deacetylase [Syntrophobacteraceae bacterium]|nr:PIG-L family deacetylase [Syntrophobacteraceae bacterium]